MATDTSRFGRVQAAPKGYVAPKRAWCSRGQDRAGQGVCLGKLLAKAVRAR